MICQSLIDPVGNDFDVQGIYLIRHIDTGLAYVGSSVDVRTRLTKHKANLRRGRHHSSYLQRAFDKYGASSFSVCVLEVVPNRLDLSSREQVWIDELDSYRNGFNARPTAENFFGMEWTEQQNEARRRSNKKTWMDAKLRQELSEKFKGRRRGTWTKESYRALSSTLKRLHQENPEWHRRMQQALALPESQMKRIEGIRHSLKNPKVRNARLKQLRKASASPDRIRNLRQAYFEKYKRSDLGVSDPAELDILCKEMYQDGLSVNEIANKIGMDHKAVSSRLRRLGIEIKRMPKVGSQLTVAKLTEEKVIEIKKMLRDGVSRSVISEINTGKSWKHVACD